MLERCGLLLNWHIKQVSAWFLGAAYLSMQTVVVSSAESGRFSLQQESKVKPQAKIYLRRTLGVLKSSVEAL